MKNTPSYPPLSSESKADLSSKEPSPLFEGERWEDEVRQYYQHSFQNHQAPSVEVLLNRDSSLSTVSSWSSNQSSNQSSPFFSRLILLGGLSLIFGLGIMTLLDSFNPSPSRSNTSHRGFSKAHKTSHLSNTSLLESPLYLSNPSSSTSHPAHTSQSTFLSFGKNQLPSDGWFVESNSDEEEDNPEWIEGEDDLFSSYLAVETDALLFL